MFEEVRFKENNIFEFKESIAFIAGLVAMSFLLVVPLHMLGLPNEVMQQLVLFSGLTSIIGAFFAGKKRQYYLCELISLLIFFCFTVLSIFVIFSSFPLVFFIKGNAFIAFFITIFTIRLLYLLHHKSSVVSNYYKAMEVDLYDPRINYNAIELPRDKLDEYVAMYRLFDNFLRGKIPMAIGVGVLLAGSFGNNQGFVVLLFSSVWLLLASSFSYTSANIFFSLILRYELIKRY